jgi:hypothetical protein
MYIYYLTHFDLIWIIFIYIIYTIIIILLFIIILESKKKVEKKRGELGGGAPKSPHRGEKQKV